MYVSRADKRRSDVMDAVDLRFFVRAPDLCPFRHTGVRGAPYRIVAVEPPGIQKHKARRVKLSCLRKEGDRASEHGAVAGLVEELKRGNAGVIPVLTDHIRGAMPLCGTAQTVSGISCAFSSERRLRTLLSCRRSLPGEERRMWAVWACFRHKRTLLR